MFELNLSAALPRTGSYSGVLTVAAGDAPTRLPVTITYVQALPTIEIDPVTPVEGNAVSLTVREIGGRTIELELPELVGLARVDDDDASVGITSENVDIDLLVPNAAPSSAPDLIVIEPDTTIRLEVELEDLPRQGKFTGTLRFAKSGSEDAVEASLEFLRRLPWWVAMLVALAGALLGEGVRRVVLPGIKRTQAQLEVARGVDAIRAIERQLAERAEHLSVRRVIEHLRLKLRLLNAAVRVGAIDAARAKTDTESLVARTQRLGWFADAVIAADAAGVIDDARADIRSVERFIIDGEGEDAVQAALQRIEERAAAGVTESEIRAFEAELVAAAVEHPAPLKAAIESAAAAVAQVKESFAKNEFRVGAEGFRNARSQWARFIGREVEARLAQKPDYVPDRDWERLEDWKERQPIGDVLSWFGQFAQQYSSLAQKALRDWIERNRLPSNASSKNHDKRAALVSAVEMLEGSLGGPPLRALAAVDDANAAHAADPLATPAPVALGRPPPTPSGLTPYWAPQPKGAARAVDRDDLEVPSSPSLQSRLARLEWFVSFLAIGLAVTSAILLIWSPDKTWGSLDEIGFLFLWAVGIHQITGVSGTAAIRRQLVAGDGADEDVDPG